MISKALLLRAIRDELKEQIAGVHGRVVVVVRDAQGNQLLPKEIACPFIAVSDAGLDFTPEASRIAYGAQQILARAYVQNLRDAEAPVLGSAAAGETGAAEFQDQIVAALQYNVLAARIAGIDQALPVSCPAVADHESPDGWYAIGGDVVMRYTMNEDAD